jgi:hypothetical protein
MPIVSKPYVKVRLSDCMISREDGLRSRYNVAPSVSYLYATLAIPDSVGHGNF